MKHSDAGREAWVVFPAKLIVDGRFFREEPIIKDTSVNPRSRERDSNDRRDYARSDPSPRRDFRGPRYNNRSDSRRENRDGHVWNYVDRLAKYKK